MTVVLIATAAIIFGSAIVNVESAPWWDLLLGADYQRSPSQQPSNSYYNSYTGGYNGYRSPRTGYESAGSGGWGSGVSGKERYKSLCRVLNADNYAFPGKVPYPSGPLCPY